ncbi:hypothetical protein J6590_083245 [Homalodisca vitripennis]|nr:hypothetical protein J6590_083245 [Homalodisca vitripennis]
MRSTGLPTVQVYVRDAAVRLYTAAEESEWAHIREWASNEGPRSRVVNKPRMLLQEDPPQKHHLGEDKIPANHVLSPPEGSRVERPLDLQTHPGHSAMGGTVSITSCPNFSRATDNMFGPICSRWVK